MNVSLEEKVVVITGCSSGIGKKIALCFAEEKAIVIANVRKISGMTDLLIEELSLRNSRFMVIEANVANKEEVEQLLDIVLKEYGHVDVLINNAGVSESNLLFNMTESQWNNVINTNLTGVFLCSKVFCRQMMKQKSGKIINIASLIGIVGEKGLSNYSASKAGVIAFTKSIAKELNLFHVQVNAVCPGRINTKLNNVQNHEGEKENDNPSHLTSLISFLIFMSSDLFNDVTGQVFHIDTRNIG